MDRVVRTFSSFEAAEEADEQFYADLTPEQRLDLLLEFVLKLTRLRRAA